MRFAGWTFVIAFCAPVAAYLVYKGYGAEAALVTGFGASVGAATEAKRSMTDSPATVEAKANVLTALDPLPAGTEATFLPAAPVLGGQVAEQNAQGLTPVTSGPAERIKNDPAITEETVRGD